MPPGPKHILCSFHCGQHAWLRLLAPWTKHNFLLSYHVLEHLQLQGCLSRKHSHKRGNLPDSLFSCRSPRPVRRTMRMGKKEKELHQVQYQRTQFVKVISGDVSRCLGQNPLLATLYSHRDLFSRISQPTRLAAMLGEHEAASLSLLGVLTSVEVPY